MCEECWPGFSLDALKGLLWIKSAICAMVGGVQKVHKYTALGLEWRASRGEKNDRSQCTPVYSKGVHHY